MLEETGIVVRIGPIAFLQEWVVPRYSAVLEPGEGYGYGLEVFYYLPLVERVQVLPGPSFGWAIWADGRSPGTIASASGTSAATMPRR